MGIERLATEGGDPVRVANWPSWPCYSDDEIRAAEAVLSTGNVNYWSGENGRRFEEEYARHVGQAHAVAVANGTLGLELAHRAFEVGAGDEVVVPCRTFIATAASVSAVGATPVLCDVDPETQTVTASCIEAVLTARTRAIVVVHLGGMPCDMDPIKTLCGRLGLILVEDCAQAHGATYKGHPVGSIGDAGVFSFCQDKIISTAGEGGMLLLSEEAAYARAVRYKDHGTTPPHETGDAPVPFGCFRYTHDSLGSNYRLTEMQSAIGRIQLEKLAATVDRRRNLAGHVLKGVGDIPGVTAIPAPEGSKSSYYKLYLRVQPESLGKNWSRDHIVTALNAEGIPTGTGSCPDLGGELAFAGTAATSVHRPAAAALGEETLMFQVHPSLQLSDMDDVLRALEKVMCHACSSS